MAEAAVTFTLPPQARHLSGANYSVQAVDGEGSGALESVRRNNK